MITKQQFIEQEIEPTLGDYAGCYDMETIADEVSDYDPRDGYVWKQGLASSEYWRIVARHTIKGE